MPTEPTVPGEAAGPGSQVEDVSAGRVPSSQVNAVADEAAVEAARDAYIQAMSAGANFSGRIRAALAAARPILDAQAGERIAADQAVLDAADALVEAPFDEWNVRCAAVINAAASRRTGGGE